MKTRLEINRQQKTRNRLFLNSRRAALVVAGLVIGFGLALPQDSLAKNKHRHHPVRVHAGHGHHVDRHIAVSPYQVRRQVYVRAGHFTVPRRIVVRSEVNRYRTYYNSRVYYAPHRHYHNVYDFPVYSRERRVIRPYAYCNGELYGGLRLSYSRPGFSVAVGW